jgi:uncharacterized membrane protein YeaQ/YmgE (transglycosylase-associated protein family)
VHAWKIRKSVGSRLLLSAALRVGLAESVMKSQMGLFMNILLGMVGAALGGFLIRIIGFALAGWIGYLIAGFIGACILIWLGRLLRR